MKIRRVLNAVCLSSIAALVAVAVSPALAQSARTRMPTGVDLGPVPSQRDLTVTVRLKLQNQAAFDKAVDALYRPGSPTYHHWMTNADLQKYAPSKAAMNAVRKELENRGLAIVSVDPLGFSIRAHGPAAKVENAFGTPIHNFQRNGHIFRANLQKAKLSGAAGQYVWAVSGLESHKAHPMIKRALNWRTHKPYPAIALRKVETSGGLSSIITDQCLASPSAIEFTTPGASLPIGLYYGNVYSPNPNLACDYTASQLQAAYGLSSAFKAGLNGKGQTIALVEAYGYPTMQSDANAFSTIMGLPQLNSSNFSIVYPDGKPFNPNAGVLTGWNTEIALDIDWSHAMAPGAKIVVVVAASQDSVEFQNAILYVAEHHLANSVSDSWETDTDLFSGPAELQAYDRVIAIAAAKGISVNFSTGDGGDNGVGSPLGAAGVPSDSPHATAIGGTAIFNNPSGSGNFTVGWGDDATFLASGGVLDPPQVYGFVGGSGGGESVYFPKPWWQKALPGTGRQTPDVSALADPYTGVPIVITQNGQLVLQAGVGGTSLASPIFSAIWAIVNQKAGHPMGQAAPFISQLAKSGNPLLQDVLPASPVSVTNVSGVIYDSSGPTFYSPTALFTGLLGTTQNFTSAIWNEGGGTYLDFGFGIDTSLTVTQGWDNVTGYGTPYMTSIKSLSSK